jgi:DNA topoisomerase I
VAARETSGPGDPDPAAVADADDVGLRYSSDDRPGISRRRRGRGFEYRDPAGRRIADARILRRIRELAVPPAWTDVWISPDPLGHLQATGRDARRRKQYRYHARFRQRREAGKFHRLLAFGNRLPAIRRRVTRDLRAPGLPRDKVIAAIVRLLELTLLRVGNEEYARLNKSFGLSTLRNRHVRVRGETVRFRFSGKSGQLNEVGVTDRRLAAVVRRCQDLPGQELFEYVDPDGSVEAIDSDAVNAYIRRAAGDDAFSAKDFRTWAGTVLAFRALRDSGPADPPGAARRNVVDAVRETAERLGNTPAVARSSYVHPAVIEAYLDDRLSGVGAVRSPSSASAPPTPAEERAVLRLIRAQARAEQQKARAGRSKAPAAGAQAPAASTPKAGGAGRADRSACRRGYGRGRAAVRRPRDARE